MNKVLIIGANSLLSVYLKEALSSRYHVTGVFHENSDRIKDAWCVPISDLPQLNDEFKAVYFISAFIPKNEQDQYNENLYHVNIGLLRRCLVQFPSAKFVLASSVSVYGKSESVLTEKSCCTNPNNYGLSKLWAENLLKNHGSYAILRISSLYGTGMNMGTFLPRIVLDALTKKRIVLYGNGGRRQNYVHVCDVAEMMMAAAERDDNDTYLATDTVSYSNKEVAELVQGAVPGTTIDYTGNDHSPSFIYDASQTHAQLGYPNKQLASEIINLITWIKK